MNTIKKFKRKIFLKVLFTTLFFSANSLSLSPEYQKQLRLGCYTNSKQYLGPEKAKKYCKCTIEMLNKKFNDNEMNKIFLGKPEEIIKNTEYATIHCQNNDKAF